jgi:hypothetical protein
VFICLTRGWEASLHANSSGRPVEKSSFEALFDALQQGIESERNYWMSFPGKYQDQETVADYVTGLLKTLSRNDKLMGHLVEWQNKVMMLI